MQVIVTATSSKVDDLILIETSTTIGDQTTTSRVGYNAEELMDNRFLSGDLETRIEALRLGAEKMTTKGIELHFKTLMKILHKEPEVTEVTGPFSEVGKRAAEALVEKLDKAIEESQAKPVKTRAKRQTKTSTESTK
jgi:hypothetical protein